MKYLPYFPSDRVGQMVTAPFDDEVKEIRNHAMCNLWRKKMTKQGYTYLPVFVYLNTGGRLAPNALIMYIDLPFLH